MFYKHLKIENYHEKIEPEIKRYVINNFFNQTIFYNKVDTNQLLSNCVNLKNWLNSFNLICRVAATTKILPNTKIGIHRDQNKEKFAINFGILNYEFSPILLFKGNYEKSIKKQIENTSVFYEDFSECELSILDKIYLNTPVVWDTTIPHSIEHKQNNIRMTLTLRFNNDISFLLKN